MGSIQVKVPIEASNVSIPQSENLVMCQLEGGFGVLPEPIEVGLLGWKRGGELEVLVLVDEEGGGIGWDRSGVEKDVMGGFTIDGETKGSGVEESENEVGVRV